SARDCTPRRRPALLTYPRPPRRAPCGRDRHLVRGASAIGRDRLTTEERLSDIVEILAHGLLWLEVLRDYHGSIRSHNFRRFVTEGGLISFGKKSLPPGGSIRLLPCYSSGIGAQRWTAYCIGSALRWSC